MKRILGTVAVVVALLGVGATPEAQRPPEVRRIGYLQAAIGLPSGFYAVLREGLRDLGYVEGRNLVIEYRAGGDRARLAELAAELVRLNVEVIVAPGGAATSVAKAATETVPIVFSHSGDPIEAGFVKSLGRPGGNMTGITWLAFELVGKRLELLKEAAPRVSRVAVLANPAHPGERRELGETEQTARAVGATVQYHQVRTVEAGGLMAYGPNRLETAKRLAVYVDKILKGRKPAELPVEQPTVFEFVINMKAAKALGLTIPPSMVSRADHVIE